MDRRGFLKLITAAGAAIAFPIGVTTPAQASSLFASGVAPLGLMREVFANDIETDSVIVRYDICTGCAGRLATSHDVQLSIDMRFARTELQSKLDEARLIAKQMFNNELTTRGLTWDDIQPLPAFAKDA